MKKYFSWMTIMMMVFVCVGFSACGDDDNDNGNPPNKPLDSSDPRDKPSDSGMTTCSDANHPHVIDLGLPSGTKWACCNVGATAPEQNGNYFAWGETKPKSEYTWDNYAYSFWWNGRKDFPWAVDIGSDIAGTGYDAATANWGDSWRMPTYDQCQELCWKCTSVMIVQNGVEGCKFTGPNGGVIFIPNSVNPWLIERDGDPYCGYYWTSTLNKVYDTQSYFLYFKSGMPTTYAYTDRSDGLTIRPVRKN